MAKLGTMDDPFSTCVKCGCAVPGMIPCCEPCWMERFSPRRETVEDRVRAELEREYTWVIAALCARSPDKAVTIYFHDVLMLDGPHSAVEKDTTQIDRIVYRLRSR